MIKDLTDLINLEENKTAIVCGLGPSLSESIEYITKNREDIVLISCNDIDLVTSLSPDYWVFANSVQTVTNVRTGNIGCKLPSLAHSRIGSFTISPK